MSEKVLRVNQIILLNTRWQAYFVRENFSNLLCLNFCTKHTYTVRDPIRYLNELKVTKKRGRTLWPPKASAYVPLAQGSGVWPVEGASLWEGETEEGNQVPMPGEMVYFHAPSMDAADWIQSLVLQLATCLTLGKSLSYFVPQFPHVWNGANANDDFYFIWNLRGSHELMFVKLAFYEG